MSDERSHARHWRSVSHYRSRRRVASPRGARPAPIRRQRPDSISARAADERCGRSAPGRGTYSALLTPQGRMIADFHLFARPDHIIADVPAGSSAVAGSRARSAHLCRRRERRRCFGHRRSAECRLAERAAEIVAACARPGRERAARPRRWIAARSQRRLRRQNRRGGAARL